MLIVVGMVPDVNPDRADDANPTHVASAFGGML